jgi:hypothetical protein
MSTAKETGASGKIAALPFPVVPLATAFCAWFAYVLLTFLSPVTDALKALGITEENITSIRLSVVAPILLIWALAAWGAGSLAAYAQRIRRTDDGEGLAGIACGLFVLVSGMMLGTLAGGVRSYLALEPTIQAPFTILNNAIAIFFPLAGLTLILIGARRLLSALRRKGAWNPAILFPVLVGVGFVAAVYLALIMTNENRQTPAGPGLAAAYYLPDWLTILLVYLPAVATWTVGLLAGTLLFAYERHATGVIYRQSLRLLVIGLNVVVFLGVFGHVLGAFGVTRLLAGGLAPLLFIVYVLLFVQAVGYALIALGARKLSRIEIVV